MHDPLCCSTAHRRTMDDAEASPGPSRLCARSRYRLTWLLLLAVVGCGEENALSPLDPSIQASVQIPRVALEEWTNAVDIFQIDDHGIRVWAYAPGHITNPAQIHVWTQGRIVGPFIPSVRHDVFYTVKINGVNSSHPIPGALKWTGNGFDSDFYSIHELNCGVQGNQSIRASSTHWARWGASIEGFPLSHTVGPIPTRSRTSNCPPQEEEEEEEDCEQDRDTILLLKPFINLSFVLSEDLVEVQSGGSVPLLGGNRELVGGSSGTAPPGGGSGPTMATCFGGGGGGGGGSSPSCSYETICIDIWTAGLGWVEYWCGGAYICAT